MTDTIKFSFAERPIERAALKGHLDELIDAAIAADAARDHRKACFDALAETLGITDAKESKAALRAFVRAFIKGSRVELGQQVEAIQELIDATATE